MKHYQKEKVGPQVTRSISIKRNQDDFLRVNNLNLSQIARDAIESLMRQFTKTK